MTKKTKKMIERSYKRKPENGYSTNCLVSFTQEGKNEIYKMCGDNLSERDSIINGVKQGITSGKIKLPQKPDEVVKYKLVICRISEGFGVGWEITGEKDCSFSIRCIASQNHPKKDLSKYFLKR